MSRNRLDCCNHHCSLQSHPGGGAQWSAPESCHPAHCYQQLPIHPKHTNKLKEDIFFVCLWNSGWGSYKTSRCKLGLFSIFVSEVEKIPFPTRLKPRIREGHLTSVIQRCLGRRHIATKTFWSKTPGKERKTRAQKQVMLFRHAELTRLRLPLNPNFFALKKATGS